MAVERKRKPIRRTLFWGFISVMAFVHWMDYNIAQMKANRHMVTLNVPLLDEYKPYHLYRRR